MKLHHHKGALVLIAIFVASMALLSQSAAAQAAKSDDATALVKQGQKLNSEGKQDEALQLYRQALEKSPDSTRLTWSPVSLSI